jgi:hypothetical protein
MRFVAAHPLGWPATDRNGRRRQCRLAGSPNCRARHDSDCVRQSKVGDSSSKTDDIAIRRISQRDTWRHTGGQSLAHLLPGDHRLGLELNVIGDTGDAPTNRVDSPFLWHIQSVSHKLRYQDDQHGVR